SVVPMALTLDIVEAWIDGLTAVAELAEDNPPCTKLLQPASKNKAQPQQHLSLLSEFYSAFPFCYLFAVSCPHS
ncbi:MAG: hypothetical protein GY943_25535, partial [Chloroflexi bacterium]|nr:hypothetical protein [Chloroflexota bacterium]